MAIWTVTKEWPGATVYIVAGGPSLRGFDFAKLRGRKTIVVNKAFYDVPFADFLLFMDSRFCRLHLPAIRAFKGRAVACSPAINEPEILNLLRIKPPPALSTDPQMIVVKATVVQGAINMAVHLGCSRIVLLGVDARRAPDGRTHYHNGHPWPYHKDPYPDQIECLRGLHKPLKRMGIEVINCSAESAVDWWPKRSVDECLELYA